MLEDQIEEAGKTDFAALQSAIKKLNHAMERELAHSAKHR